MRRGGRGFQGRCRANMAHIRQPKPDSGLGFQVKKKSVLIHLETVR